MNKYTLAIIGSGSAGLSAADLASRLGLGGVVLIEKEPRLGGECLHSGCVPSKALIHAASLVQKDPVQAWQHLKASIAAIEQRSDNTTTVQASGVDVLTGAAKLIDKRTIQVGDQTIRTKYILLATGSSPSIPPIPGIETVPYLTNETFFAQDALPRQLTIIGGGPIGCELAGAASLLGTSVVLLQSGERLLPREAIGVSSLMKESLEAQGVQVILNAETKQVSKQADGRIEVQYSDGAERIMQTETLLIAAGRVPRTEGIGLEDIGVKVGKAGVITNHYLQTSRKNIYAAGDVTIHPKFTHLAAQHAGLAIRNMLSGPFKKKLASLSEIPAITFTKPEVARVGIDSDAARQEGYVVVSLDYNEIDRAITDSQAGTVEVAVNKKDLIVGVTVVGASASELFSPLLVAMRERLPLQRLATTMFAYPTLASGLNIIASRYAAEKATRTVAVRVLRRSWKKKNP